jgi:hypothetical protein
MRYHQKRASPASTVNQVVVQPVVQLAPTFNPVVVQPVVQLAPTVNPVVVQPVMQLAPTVNPVVVQPVVQLAPTVNTVVVQPVPISPVNRIDQSASTVKPELLPFQLRPGPLQRDAQTYIGGYILSKWLQQNPCQVCRAALCSSLCTSDYIRRKTYAVVDTGLTEPSSEVIDALASLEVIFDANYARLMLCPPITSSLLQLSSHVPFPFLSCGCMSRDFVFRKYFIIRLHHQCHLLSQYVKGNKQCARKHNKNIHVLATKLRNRALYSRKGNPTRLNSALPSVSRCVK